MIANHHRELSFATEFITLMAILPVLISAAHGIFSQCISAVPFAFIFIICLLNWTVSHCMKISWSYFQVYHNSKTRRDAIASIIYPAATKQMQSFSGAAYFFHTHIPNYAHWASDICECTTTGCNWSPNSWSKDDKAHFHLPLISLLINVISNGVVTVTSESIHRWHL